MLKPAILCVAALLCGCSTVAGKFENRLVLTLSCDRAYVVSEYGPIGISSRLAGADAQALCKP